MTIPASTPPISERVPDMSGGIGEKYGVAAVAHASPQRRPQDTARSIDQSASVWAQSTAGGASAPADSSHMRTLAPMSGAGRPANIPAQASAAPAASGTDEKSTAKEKAGWFLATIGVILILGVMIKGMIGYYLHELTWMVPLIVTGFIFGFIAKLLLKDKF